MKKTILAWLLLNAALSHAQDFKVIGYLAYWNFDDAPTKIEWERLTHVNLAFANPDADDNFSFDGGDPGPVVEAAHQAGVEVFASLAGGYLSPAWQSSWNYWMQPARLDSFVDKIVDYVQTKGFDGVDIDLEWQHVNDLYSPFILALKPALEAEGIPLTAALPGSYRYPQITAPALAAFDWVNLMVYDLTGPWAPNSPGQHSPLWWAEDCLTYWSGQGLPGERQTLGVPFYGYDFSTSPVDAKYFGEIVAANPANAQLDQVGQLYYNGIPTIVAKTQLAQAESSGIMIWELGQDAFESLAEFSLLRTIDETLHQVSGVGEMLAISPLPYPNPASNYLLVGHLPKVENFAQVIDFQGKTRWEGNLEAEGRIDLKGLPAGMYALRVMGKNGINATVSFVKIN
jgi:chitinase